MVKTSVAGNVGGDSLVRALLCSQASIRGDQKRSRSCGIRIFSQYLGRNSARQEAWVKNTPLSPEVVFARASLDSAWLKQAGQWLETSTDPKQRAAMLKRLGAEKLEPENLYPLPEIELPMVPHIPTGPFTMGSQQFDDAKPLREIILDPFSISIFPVTRAQYLIGMQQAGLITPEYWKQTDGELICPSHPVTGVTWEQANAFAEWLGRRLPTEAEWEFSARGYDEKLYPWGNIFDPSRAAFHQRGTSPVDAYPTGVSWNGIFGLAGNICEWCADWYASYDPSALHNPRGPEEGSMRVLRGGSHFYDEPELLRSDRRNKHYPSIVGNSYGFRVAEGGIVPPNGLVKK
ncbi:MAG: SUMF1/EgtB/PvdO family nonheme iron enzyme [Candidatus Margulisiibacteriota bacterium]